MQAMAFTFRRPLGLALAGGSAHGAWQAGCLAALARAGLTFDKVIGFSAGAVCGAGYFLGLQEEVLRQWKNVSENRVLRFSPRLRPISFFSSAPIWDAVRKLSDETRARGEGRCELIVVSLRKEDRMPVYSRFAPRGEKGWDGPFLARLVASCSLPWLFPPVEIAENFGVRTYVDGGISGCRPISFEDLGGCADVITLEMVRPEEIGRRRWGIISGIDQRIRETARAQMNAGVESLLRLSAPPRIFRVEPSKILDYLKFSYRSRHCAPAADLGIADGESFLTFPEQFLVRNKDGEKISPLAAA